MTRPTNSIVITKGNPHDAERLSALAARLFLQTYAGSLAASDIESYVAEHFNAAQQRAELGNASITTLLVEGDGLLMGFAQLRVEPIPVAVNEVVSAQLWRIYLDESCHGLGIGQRLVSEVRRIARRDGHDSIWLSVWERNGEAIAFYKRQGLAEAGNLGFRVGAEIQNDLVLVGSC